VISKTSKRAAYGVMGGIVVVWVAAYFATRLLSKSWFDDPYGPIYDGLNVLFTALAFGGVIVTLVFQAEEAKVARREAIESSIFEMFQIFTSPEFQLVKDHAYRALLAAIKDKEYAEFLASRLFVVDQLPFPMSSSDTVRSLDKAKVGLTGDDLIAADRDDRLKLDNLINFLSMLAQRESSGTVIKHCDFAYDWWRPALWIVAQLQIDRFNASPEVQKYCKNRPVIETLRKMDAIYEHTALDSATAVWDYVAGHPKMIQFGLDPRFSGKPRGTEASSH